MKVQDNMKTKVYSISTDKTVADATALMVGHHIGTLPVLDEHKKLVGVIYQRDLLSLVMPDFVRLVSDFAFVHDFGALEDAEPSVEELARPVTSVMREAVRVRAHDSILLAAALLHKHGVSDLPVVDQENSLVGILSHVDVGSGIMKRWLD